MEKEEEGEYACLHAKVSLNHDFTIINPSDHWDIPTLTCCVLLQVLGVKHDIIRTHIHSGHNFFQLHYEAVPWAANYESHFFYIKRKKKREKVVVGLLYLMYWTSENAIGCLCQI